MQCIFGSDKTWTIPFVSGFGKCTATLYNAIRLITIITHNIEYCIFTPYLRSQHKLKTLIAFIKTTMDSCVNTVVLKIWHQYGKHRGHNWHPCQIPVHHISPWKQAPYHTCQSSAPYLCTFYFSPLSFPYCGSYGALSITRKVYVKIDLENAWWGKLLFRGVPLGWKTLERNIACIMNETSLIGIMEKYDSWVRKYKSN